MDKNSIGINAGRVWQLLSAENKQWEYEELKRELKISDRELNTAIGWLAREDKIQFYEDKSAHKDYLYLETNNFFG